MTFVIIRRGGRPGRFATPPAWSPGRSRSRYAVQIGDARGCARDRRRSAPPASPGRSGAGGRDARDAAALAGTGGLGDDLPVPALINVDVAPAPDARTRSARVERSRRAPASSPQADSRRCWDRSRPAMAGAGAGRADGRRDLGRGGARARRARHAPLDDRSHARGRRHRRPGHQPVPAQDRPRRLAGSLAGALPRLWCCSWRGARFAAATCRRPPLGDDLDSCCWRCCCRRRHRPLGRPAPRCSPLRGRPL